VGRHQVALLEKSGTRRFRHAFEDEDAYETELDEALRAVLKEVEKRRGSDETKQEQMRKKREEMDADKFEVTEETGDRDLQPCFKELPFQIQI
jgi:hypothetical protein